MCVSTDNKTCVLTGLPLVKHTNYGRFCTKNCGLVEAIVRNEMLRETLGNKTVPSKTLKTNTSLGATQDISETAFTAANRFIDKIHKWIETVVDSTDFD